MTVDLNTADLKLTRGGTCGSVFFGDKMRIGHLKGIYCVMVGSTKRSVWMVGGHNPTPSRVTFIPTFEEILVLDSDC